MTHPTNRPCRRRRLPASLALSACLAALPAPAASAGDDPGVLGNAPLQWALSNGAVRAEFTSDDQAGGTSVELASLRNLVHAPALTGMPLNPGSGGWTLRFVVEGSGAADWFEVSMDGSTDASAAGVGSLDALDLDGVTIGAASMVALWNGTLTVGGQTSDFEVRGLWSLAGGEPAIDTRLLVDMAVSPLDFYLSEVVYPTVRVADFATPDDTLLLPWIGGSLVNDPTNPAHPFKVSLSTGSNFFPANVAAYYDGEVDSRCFAMAATDMDDFHKDLWLSIGEDDGTRHVQFEMRHIPTDVFDASAFALPYDVRLGALAGDWWDVAHEYQRMLSALTTWYQGPVGSPANDMPTRMKDRVAEVFLQPGYEGDNTDLLSRSMMTMSRVLGGRVNAVYYGAHAPDRFDEWYFNGGYLPGRPSLVGAVQTGQAQFDHAVSLYVNGTSAADYTDPAIEPPITEPSPELQAALDSFILEEDGAPRYIYGIHAPPRRAYLCSAAPWWRDELPAMVRELALYTGMQGVYLDYFLTGPCYATDHAHTPGGGNWMYTERMGQLADVKQAPFEELLMPIEFLHGRFTEEVDGMHADPAGNLLSAQDHPGTTIPQPMQNAVSVPFFRAVYDNVKMSRITAQFPSNSGRRAWTEANNVFTFGQIPGIVRPLAELVPVFSERYRFAPYYTYIDPDLGGPGNQPLDAGEAPGSTTEVFHPDKEAVNVPYLRYLSTLTQVLRNQGFATWHTGTLRRLPDWEIVSVAPPDFDAVPGVELEVDDQYQRQSPVYVEEWLVPGMFQAPADLPEAADAGSLAFVLTNPWVDPFEAAVFQADFTVDPSDYPDWDLSTQYTVTLYDDAGNEAGLPGVFSGHFVLSNATGSSTTLTPGTVRWWVFRKWTPVIDPGGR